MIKKLIVTILLAMCSLAIFAQECYFGHEYVQAGANIYRIRHINPDFSAPKLTVMYLESPNNVILFKRPSYRRSTGEACGNGDINPLALLRDETVPYRIMQSIMPEDQFAACCESWHDIFCYALFDPVSREVGEIMFEVFYSKENKQMLTVTPDQLSEFEKQFRTKIIPVVSFSKRYEDWDFVRLKCSIFHPEELETKGEVLTK